MVEQGHFQELSSILELIHRKRYIPHLHLYLQWTSISIEALIFPGFSFWNGFLDSQPVSWGKWLSFYKILTLVFLFRSDNDEDEGTAKRRHLQKFIFSATLTLPKSFNRKGKEKKITSEEGLGKSRHIWLRVIEAKDSINVIYQLLLKEWNDLNYPSFKTQKFAALSSVSEFLSCCFCFCLCYLTS